MPQARGQDSQGGGMLPPANAPTPPARKYISFTNFKTMNSRNARIGLEPDELPWCENMLIVGPNNLISVPGANAPVLHMMGKQWTIQRDAFMNGQHYSICFASDGSAFQVNKTTGISVNFAAPGTFSNPDITVYNAQRILIADPSAGYCTWDGLVFVKQGMVSPNITVTAPGSGYITRPNVAITGGSGTGATATANILLGAVVSITLTNPGTGYLAADTLTVMISGGGGTGATANAFPWPFLNVQPISLDIWQGQVWIVAAANNAALSAARILAYSGSISQDAVLPTSVFYDNFRNGGTGTSFITDQDLVEGLTAVRGFDNFLYVFGSNSVRQIAAKVISGSPAVTNFTLTTISSDQGTIWKNTITSFNKFVIFANQTGVLAIFGATVTKISGPMDGTFLLANFNTVIPQSAVVDIYGKHVFCLLIQINDPLMGLRPVLVSLVDESWFLMSAGNLNTISTAAINGLFTLWGSSGGDVTQFFANLANPVSILIKFALTDDKDGINNKRVLRASISHSAFASLSLTWTQETENAHTNYPYMLSTNVTWVSQNAVITFVNSLNQVVTFAASGYLYKPLGVTGTGIYLGGSLSGTVTQLTLNAVNLEYIPEGPMRSI